MTRQNTAKLLPIITAYSEGKAIQLRNHNSSGWIDCEIDLDFNEPPDHYRIKPEPREFWLSKYQNGNIYVYSTKDQAEGSVFSDSKKELIHVREVI